MFKKLLDKIKCKLACCFQSKCTMKLNDTDADGVPDELDVEIRDKEDKIIDELSKKYSFI